MSEKIGMIAAATGGVALVFVGAIVSGARRVSEELEGARARREAVVRAERRKFEESQIESDRAVASGGMSRLRARLEEVLPVPTAADLRGGAGDDRGRRAAMWGAMACSVVARLAAAVHAQCLCALSSRAQLAAVAGHPQPLTEALRDRFSRLRAAEHLVLSPDALASLADASRHAADAALSSWPLSRPMSSGDLLAALVAIRASLWPFVSSRASDLLLPRSSASSPADGATDLLLFHSRRVISSRPFLLALDAAISSRLVSMWQRASPLFTAAGPGKALILPKLAPFLAVVIADSLEPDSLAAALQEIGSLAIVDRLMFDIFSGNPDST